MEYDNIISLAKKSNYKKIMIIKKGWANGAWCIVNKVIINPDEKYGKAFGHIHYANGNEKRTNISGAGTYNWKIIKVFDEDMEVKRI